ncbi:MAG: 2-C-methyl-D-erythritol 4-phosphate cytidylyltransferase [Dermatophilaceae bacterium]
MSTAAPERPRRTGVGVVVVAAGAGSRLGSPLPKALVEVAGHPLLWYAVSAALQCDDTAYLVVVAPPGHEQATRAVVAPLAAAAGVGSRVVSGGAERGDSVLSGLQALPHGIPVVLVHDAARAFAPPGAFSRVAAAVRAGHPAVVPGEPVVDTVKVVDASGVVTATPERTSLRAVQTPQGFERDTLVRAHALGSLATDDAALVERLGVPVLVVEGHPDAFKVTTAADLQRAERLVASRAAPWRSM